MDASAEPLEVYRHAAVRSGLIDAARWQSAVQTVGNDLDALTDYFVQHQLLTAYQAQQLRVGRGKLTLGPYLITDWIGQGGMGQVFKAVHTVMGRQSAVKVLPIEKSTAESRESFLREIRLQAGLDCPYLVRAYDAGHDGNVHYLVTEYVPGTDLRRLVRQQGPLSMTQAAGVIRDAALGLQYAHQLGLIHRDVKPGNILVTPAGRAKVSDVGLATWSMGLREDPRAGKVVGTADYLSPEQIRSPQSIGPASDIYSLGCSLYYAVTGKVPYPGGDARSKCRRHLEETPWHPRRFAPDLAEEFVELVAEMMEKDPQRRLASAALVAERLLPWYDGEAEPLQPPPSYSPWMPAPPPAETLPPPLADDVNREGTSQASAGDERSTVPPFPISGWDARNASLVGPLSDGPPPIPYLTETDRPTTDRRQLDPMVLWLVLAIVVPISLFIGALLGFLIRGWL